MIDIPTLSFCITCKNRIHQIRQTLRQNLEDNPLRQKFIKFTMLNRGNITVFFHYIKIFSLMKQVIFILIFAFTANYTLSQSLTISPPIFRHQYDVTTIDSGNIRILYALNAIDINDTQTYDDIQRLDIGSKFSKYYSSYVYQDDSLKKDFVKKHPNVKSIPNNLG